MYYGAHFWALPTWYKTEGFYGWSLNYYTHHSLIPWLLLVACVVAAVGLTFRKVRVAWFEDSLFHEHILAVVLLGLPFVAYFATKTAHGGLDDRYTVYAVLAYPLGAGYILRRMNRVATMLVALLIFSALVRQETNFWKSQRGHVGAIVSPADPVESLVEAAGHAGLPVLVSDGHDYLPLLHYASPEWGKRFFAVVDLPQEIAYTNTDSISKSLLALQCCYPLQVEQFMAFASKHPQFLILLEWERLGLVVFSARSRRLRSEAFGGSRRSSPLFCGHECPRSCCSEGRIDGLCHPVGCRT